MPQIAYTSTARKGWDILDRLVWWALTRYESAIFEDIAKLLPEGLPDRHIFLALHGFACAGRAEFTAGEWRPVRDTRETSAVGVVVSLRTYDAREAA